MPKQLIPAKEYLLFEIDFITSDSGLIGVKPQGYNIELVFSPYFINKLVTYAIKQGILEKNNEQQNKTR